jgi:hypothetical protein
LLVVEFYLRRVGWWVKYIRAITSKPHVIESYATLRAEHRRHSGRIAS